MLIRFRKTLKNPTVSGSDSSLRIRAYRGPDDIQAWLEIRKRALAGQVAAGRPWTEHDFRREFLEKPWWRPEWLWFAEKAGSISPVGAAALRALESDLPGASVQWLLVVPEYRRCGVGRQLISHLELAAWNGGCRMIFAETLASWEAAVRFYESLGYRARG